jgi:hypothetical protein
MSRKGVKINITINGKNRRSRILDYLGITLAEDGRYETEVKIRIALAKETFNKKRAINKMIQKKV